MSIPKVPSSILTLATDHKTQKNISVFFSMRTNHLKMEIGNPRTVMDPPNIHQAVDNITLTLL
jgi:hypothetical protein